MKKNQKTSRASVMQNDEEEHSDKQSVNVLDVLKEDHQQVKQLFEEFENAKGSAKQTIVEEVLGALEIHSKIEEDLVYPAIRKAADEEQQEKVDEANEEHHVVALLSKELRKLKASDDGYRAKFMVLSELVKHHIEEEEGEMFSRAEQTDIDLEKLGQEAMKIKARMTKQKASGRQRRAA